MATVTRTYMTDDLDSSEENVRTVLLGLDGATFEIDLSEANDARLRDKLARFVDAAHAVKAPKATRAKRGAKTAAVASNRQQTQEIREWAKQAGLKVSDRGRISAEVVEKYKAEH